MEVEGRGGGGSRGKRRTWEKRGEERWRREEEVEADVDGEERTRRVEVEAEAET